MKCSWKEGEEPRLLGFVDALGAAGGCGDDVEALLWEDLVSLGEYRWGGEMCRWREGRVGLSGVSRVVPSDLPLSEDILLVTDRPVLTGSSWDTGDWE